MAKIKLTYIDKLQIEIKEDKKKIKSKDWRIFFNKRFPIEIKVGKNYLLRIILINIWGKELKYSQLRQLIKDICKKNFISKLIIISRWILNLLSKLIMDIKFIIIFNKIMSVWIFN